MAKRSATSNLNQYNWNDAEESEDMGAFKKASTNELKMRSIKRAKRRGAAEGKETPSIFKDFKAFGVPDSQPSTPSFGFLSGEERKPTLPNSSPFPSFSFGNSNTTSPKVTEKPMEEKSLAHNSPVETNMFKSPSPSTDCGTDRISSPLSSNKENVAGSNTSFKFGITSDTPKSSAPTSLSNFIFNPAKSVAYASGTTPTSTFKFGLDKEKEAVKPDGNKPSFQFGLNADDPPHRESTSTKAQSKPANLKDFLSSTKMNGLDNSKEDLSSSKNNSVLLANLKSLNVGVLNWIKQHLDKNYYVNLTPVFDDYKKHLDEIYKTGESGSGSNSSSSSNKENSLGDISIEVKNVENKDSRQLVTKPNSPTLKSTSINSTAEKSNKETFSFGTSLTSSKTSNADTTPNTEKSSFALNNAASLSKTEDSPQKEGSDSVTKQSAPMFSFGAKDNKPSFSFGSSDKSNKSTFSFGGSTGDNNKSTFSFGGAGSDTSKPTFSFGSGGEKPKSTFGFGSGSENKSTFEFGSSDNSTKTSGFSFSSSNPAKSGFSFDVANNANNLNSENSSETNVAAEESDEPPKVEVKEVKEDDALYEKRVKLFYKKEDKYVDKGVGTLYLKPAGDKCQLLVRAHTNLGNILLNIILNSSLPTQRMGKNNVLLVCVPNPPIDANAENTPVSMLIRVKTAEDADELLKQIVEHKK